MTTAVLSAETVRQALRQVKDPELDMNIVDLGLVYDVEVDDGEVRINMTLTSPGCPAGPMITNDIYKVVRAIESVAEWLGNTPAVARKSYVDPGVIDAYLDGGLVGKGSSEAAVLKLLRRRSTKALTPRG